MSRQPLVRPWSKAEVTTLQQLWFSKATVLHIAHRLRRTKSGVMGKAKVLGLPCKTTAETASIEPEQHFRSAAVQDAGPRFDELPPATEHLMTE